ncbi:hypothetical protein C0J56_00585 [Pseudomonas fluorescens]|nr:hypothetical protein C0J56_00585 [Pseudomonas fluorescens]
MGASLLAIAVDQSRIMLTDTPPSRAGSLPQVGLLTPADFPIELVPLSYSPKRTSPLARRS